MEGRRDGTAALTAALKCPPIMNHDAIFDTAFSKRCRKGRSRQEASELIDLTVVCAEDLFIKPINSKSVNYA